jgi:glucose-6-phosphate dehydrogenase assembly protein OpcA
MPAAPTVKPDRILHDLAELWTTMGKHDPADPAVGDHKEDAGVLRACAMTLIVFVDEEDDPMALGETLALLMREHPSRAIVVRLREGGSPAAGDLLEARVFAQCWMPFGQRRQICCEQVEVSASLNRLPDIPSIVAPLAAPDLPRVVWFRSSRVESAPDIGELLALGDKIIVDSTRPGSPAFADLRALVAAGFIVADLAWTALTRLRELIAQLLDERDLATVKKVLIGYSGNEAAPGAKYLQAWLRSEIAGAAVDLRRADAAGHGAVKTIRIDPDLNIQVESNCAEYQSGSLRQRANLSACSEHQLLSEELSITTHDPVFERALQRMTAWTPRS